jgi:hypothetical protein
MDDESIRKDVTCADCGKKGETLLIIDYEQEKFCCAACISERFQEMQDELERHQAEIKEWQYVTELDGYVTPQRAADHWNEIAGERDEAREECRELQCRIDSAVKSIMSQVGQKLAPISPSLLAREIILCLTGKEKV